MHSNNFNVKDFSNWVLGGKFTRNEDVRSLEDVLNDDEARECFLRLNFKSAMEILDRKRLNKDLLSYPIDELAQALRSKIDSLKIEKKREINSNRTGHIYTSLEGCYEAINDLFEDFNTIDEEDQD